MGHYAVYFERTAALHALYHNLLSKYMHCSTCLLSKNFKYQLYALDLDQFCLSGKKVKKILGKYMTVHYGKKYCLKKW